VIAIGETFGCKLAIAALFESPSLRALAAHVDEAKAAAGTAPGQRILRLREGERAPMWMPGPVHGNAVCYMRFARLLRRELPCYGLQTPGLDGERTPIADFNALAAHHVGTIREHQPRGPYMLGGWSMGGSLAFEVAVQLERLGEHVSHLLLIGSTPPSPDHLEHARATMKGYEPWRMAYFYLRSLAFSLGIPIALDFDEYSRLSTDAVVPRFIAQLRTLGPLGGDTTEELALRWLGIVRANLYGFHHHVPSGAFHGRTLLLRTAGENPLLKDSLLRERNVSAGTWDGLLAGIVDTREVAANHYTIMLEPWIDELAAVVNDWVDGTGALSR
jgi:thioesterase domain-containing protein